MVGFLSNSKVKNLYERGLEKTRKGDAQGAMRDFSEVLKLDPKNADAYFRRGYLLMRNGNLNGAAYDFVQALKLNPNHDSASMMKEMLKRAKEMLDRNTAPAPATPPPAQAVATPTVTAQPSFVDSQITAKPSETADEAPTVTPELFIQRGIELYENDQVEEAIDTFIEALKIDPDNADAYINLGAIYHAHDEDELAHEYFKTALALAPDHPDAARMRELLRMTEEAINTRRDLIDDASEDSN